MEKKLSVIWNYAIAAIVGCAVTACSESEFFDNDTSTAEQQHTCTMILQAQAPTFTPADSRRASTADWEDNSKVYLELKSGSNIVRGTATYSATSAAWTVTYTGTITQGASTCTALYFENIETTNTGFRFTDSTAVYQDLAAQYSFDGSKLVVGATLKPRTGRIKFNGSCDRLFVQGLTRYTGYNQGTGTFTTTEDPMLINVKNGTTHYVYASFADEKNRKLRISDMKSVYEKSFPATVLAVGESGYMDVPTATDMLGWGDMNPFAFIHIADSISAERKQIISEWIDDMVRVESTKDFLFSGTYPTIVSPFYINKCEVTQKVYRAVMNRDFRGYNGSLGDRLPIYSYSVQGDGSLSNYYDHDIIMGAWSDGYIYIPSTGYGTYIAQVFTEFINKLNLITGLKFDYPTEAEWEYAAHGGQNYVTTYKFAGSNNINDVATYSWNEFDVVEVAKKQANTLGIYDMTGNVSEICYYIGSNLSSTEMNINPKAFDNFYCWRGGNNYDCTNYGEDAELTNRTRHSSTSNLYQYYYGLRLVLRMME